MGLFIGGLFVGIPLGIILTIIISACLVNRDNKDNQSDDLFTIRNILNLKFEINNDPELKDVHLNIGIDKSNIVIFIVDTEISHNISCTIIKHILDFEKTYNTTLDSIIVTKEETNNHYIRFKYYI